MGKMRPLSPRSCVTERQSWMREQLTVKTSRRRCRHCVGLRPGRGVGQGRGGRPGSGGVSVGVCPVPMASFGSTSCESGRSTQAELAPFRSLWPTVWAALLSTWLALMLLLEPTLQGEQGRCFLPA